MNISLLLEKDDSYFMNEALKEAQKAFDSDEVPIGCVVVEQGKIIARAYNMVERLNDSTAHAEMLAITQACEFRKSKWLNGCTVYVTIEPCLMCANAFVLSRVDRVVFGASEPKTGALGSLVDISTLPLNHKYAITKNISDVECTAMMQRFFKNKREQKKLYKE